MKRIRGDWVQEVKNFHHTAFPKPHLVNVPRCDEIHANVESLLPDVHVRAGECPQDIHHHVLHHLTVLFLQLLQPLEDYQLDIIVTLRNEQLAVAVGRGTDCTGCLREGYQRYSTLVHNSGAAAVKKGQDDLDVTTLLCWCRSTYLIKLR